MTSLSLLLDFSSFTSILLWKCVRKNMVLYWECPLHENDLSRMLCIVVEHLLCARRQFYRHMYPTRISRRNLHGSKQIEKWASKEASLLDLQNLKETWFTSNMSAQFSSNICVCRLYWKCKGTGVEPSGSLRTLARPQALEGKHGFMLPEARGCFYLPGTNPFLAAESLYFRELLQQSQEPMRSFNTRFV